MYGPQRRVIVANPMVFELSKKIVVHKCCFSDVRDLKTKKSNNEILVSPTKKRADRLPVGFFVCKTYQTAPFVEALDLLNQYLKLDF